MTLNGNNTTFPVNTFYRRDQDFLNLLDKIIKQNYSTRGFGLQEMSVLMQMSKRQVQRKLKILTGSTPSEYLRTFRLKKSQKFLDAGITVGEVAHAVGFSSQSYFASCFKAFCDQTPTDYQHHQLSSKLH